MANSNATVSSAQAVPMGSANDDVQLLGTLVKLWASYNKRSLEVRLETGRLLNDRAGPPTQRQSRCGSVLKRASEELHVSPSELNRMRWFAYLSKDDESFWGDIPTSDRSWTKFKTLLPRLLAAAKGGTKRGAHLGNTRTSSSIDGVLRSIRSAVSKLRSEKPSVGEAQKDELIRDLRDFASAVANAVGVRFRLEVEDEAGDQGLPQALAEFGCERNPNSSQFASTVTA